jgi:Cysteine dioxygenase type I
MTTVLPRTSAHADSAPALGDSPFLSPALGASPLLSPAHLVDFTRMLADDVRSGLYPFVDYDTDRRWHQRIYRDARVDVWLISWLPTQGTQLHDHGGSAGAFTVVSGELAEAVYLRSDQHAGTLRERAHRAEESVGFSADYVHDVRNLSVSPAVSVHAYSRPLTAMTYYDLDGGALIPVRTLATDDPEPSLIAGNGP